MRQLLVMLVVGLFTLGPAMELAEARRLGGGGNIGSVSRSADRPAASPGQQQATPPRQAQGQAAGSRMPGMLGGLLAGGLLAALFFGGAFDELRLTDILVIAALAFAVIWFLRRRTAMAAAGAGNAAPQPRGGQAPQPNAQAFQASTPLSGGSSAFASEPEWFDRERFLSGAKEHFMTLQRAWDNNDFAGIQEYVTPELYNLLREERAQHPANNRTEIVRLFAEMGDIREAGKQAEATVIFHGILEENGEQVEFNETWHLIREVRDGAPWYLQGIEQNSGA